MCNFQVFQEGGSTVRRFPVCPGRRAGVCSASWCVQEGQSATCSFPVCPGRIVDSKQRPGVPSEEIMRERLHCCSQTTMVAIGEDRESNADW